MLFFNVGRNKTLTENVLTRLAMIDYVEPNMVANSPTKVIPSALPTNIKRLKMSDTPSSSNWKSSIGQQFSMLQQEDNKIAYDIINDRMNMDKYTKNLWSVVLRVEYINLVSKY